MDVEIFYYQRFEKTVLDRKGLENRIYCFVEKIQPNGTIAEIKSVPDFKCISLNR